MNDAAELILRTLPMVWLGMVVAISVIETPLKFRAPGMTLELGLGIGRLVFHALNRVELVLAALITPATIVALAGDAASAPVAIGAATTLVALLVQVLVLRPTLDRRLDARLRGDAVAASRHHLAYIALELLKLLALGLLGIAVALDAVG